MLPSSNADWDIKITNILSEVVGSNPTRSTFYCCTTTVLIQTCFWAIVGQNPMAKIFEITNAMKIFVPYVCRSHIVFALNCGEGYLPYQRNDEKKVELYFLMSQAAADELRRKQGTFESIASKIVPNMNTNEQEFGIRTHYNNPDLVQSIMKNAVTNLHYKETGKKKTKKKRKR